MTSTLKTEKIQFRGDNSDAITLASSGKVGIGTTSPSEALHVKGFTRIESNAGDAAYVRFVNDVNSGGKTWRAGAGLSAHGTFSIYNQTDNKFGVNVNSTGLVSRPETPAVFATRNSTEQIFSGNLVVVTDLDSSYYNSYSTNNKSWWDASTSKYTAPTGSGTTYHYVSLSSLYGVTIPSSGTNYGLIGIYHSGTATANNIYRAYMDVPNEIGTAGNMKFNTLTACGVVKMVAGNFLQPYADGTNGVNKRVHSGTYTNFSAIQIA